MVVISLFLLLIFSAIPTQGVRSSFFYVSEQGDEYASMSLYIARELAIGSGLVRVSMFNGEGHRTLNDVFTGKVPCPLKDHPESIWPDVAARQAHIDTLDEDGYHTITLTPDEILASRNAEFKEAMEALGLQACTSFSSLRNCYDILPLDATFMNNNNGFWGDSLTTAYYNLIYETETLNPGSMHICAGSPRDCRGVNEDVPPNPKNLACWYAARQLMADYPNGVNTLGWGFDFMMADFPYTSTNPTPGSVLTASQAQVKIDDAYSSTFSKPLTTPLGTYSDQKIAAGSPYSQFDPAAGRYAIGLHLYPQQFASTGQNPNVYEEQITEYTAEELNVRWCGPNDPVVPVVSPTTKSAVDLPVATLTPGAIAAIVICSLIFVCVCCIIFVAFGAAGCSMPDVDRFKLV